MDVYSLSDEELIEQLKLYNIEYGPIADTTRRIYQKKLAKVMKDGPSEPFTSSSDTMPVDELDYGDEEEEPEPEPVRTAPRRTEKMEVRQRVPREYVKPEYQPEIKTTRDLPKVQQTTYSKTTKVTSSYLPPSTTTQPKSKPVSADDLVTQVEEPPEPKKGGLSIWIQLLIVLIVAILIFLVFQNMEPGDVPTRQLGHDQ